jgi:hypothetical protein
VPWAYRVFFRQVGVDPDSERTPVERIAVERLEWGGLRSANLLDDALVIATVETGVPVIAFDAEKVGRHLGLRLSRRGESLGEQGRTLSTRQIVVADEDRPLSVLFGEIAEDRGVTRRTRRMVLVALRVKGVPLNVEAVESIVYGGSGITGYMIEVDGAGESARLLLEKDVDLADGQGKIGELQGAFLERGIVWDGMALLNELPSITKSGAGQKNWKKTNVRTVSSVG